MKSKSASVMKEVFGVGMTTLPETRGGSRPGSGRPKEKPTKVLSYRVPLDKANKIDKEIRKMIKLCASPSSY